MPSLHQGIFRSSSSILSCLMQVPSIPSPSSLPSFWECIDSRYLLLQYTTSQVTSKIQLSSEKRDISIFWSSIISCISSSTEKITRTQFLLHIAFHLLDHLTNLHSYNHYPCFSISMPSNHSGPSFTRNYYDIAGRQTNTTIQGDVNG